MAGEDKKSKQATSPDSAGVSVTRIVRCPRCGKSSEFSPKNPYRPFCCERCRTGDLADWADGRYAVPVDNSQVTPEDLEALEQALAEKPFGTDDPES